MIAENVHTLSQSSDLQCRGQRISSAVGKVAISSAVGRETKWADY